MSIPEKWKYVYWFASFCLYSLFIAIFRYFLHGFAAITAVTLITILSVTGISIYIEGRLFWGHWNIVHIAGNKWKCLQCGETFSNKPNILREDHKIMGLCEINLSDDIGNGCGKTISLCNQEHHKQQYCILCNRYYQVCTEKHENCRFSLDNSNDVTEVTIDNSRVSPSA